LLDSERTVVFNEQLRQLVRRYTG